MTNKHTVSLKLAQQMKKAGWKKETLFWWTRGEMSGWNVFPDKQVSSVTGLLWKPQYPAPIASEILEELPAYSKVTRTKTGYNARSLLTKDDYFRETTPAEALGKLYCYLKKEDLI